LELFAHRQEAAQKIGYLPENGPLYPEMTPLQLLRFFGTARGLSKSRLKARIETVIAQCNLQSVLEKSIHKLSKGYRQRVGMAQVLLHEPDILIMDEPTSGLDPNQIHDVRQLIRHLGRDKTILLSTHILQEVEAVASRVLLINEGRIVFDGTPAQMTTGHSLEEAFYRLTGNEKTADDSDLGPKPNELKPVPDANPPAVSTESGDLPKAAEQTEEEAL
jgi:ABC-2 type transport system ATP-binding protein